jgi:hypothetical protein
VNELMPRQTIATLVEQHDAIQAQAQQGITLLFAAQALMKVACGGYASVLPDAYGFRRVDSWITYGKPEDAAAKAQLAIQEGFWKYTLAQTGVGAMMSPADRERMHKMFEEHKTPPFDLANVVATLQGLAENSDEIFKGAARAVWELFRPGTSWANRHKTNADCSGVQRKVILSWGYSWSSSYMDLDVKQRFNELNKVFHVLDGKGLPKADNNLGLQMEQARRAGQKGMETEYFKLAWFDSAGTIHLIFRRLDLLQQLNRIGGEGSNELKENRA